MNEQPKNSEIESQNSKSLLNDVCVGNWPMNPRVSEGYILCQDCCGLGWQVDVAWHYPDNDWQDPEPEEIQVECIRCGGEGEIQIMEMLANE